MRIYADFWRDSEIEPDVSHYFFYASMKNLPGLVDGIEAVLTGQFA